MINLKDSVCVALTEIYITVRVFRSVVFNKISLKSPKLRMYLLTSWFNKMTSFEFPTAFIRPTMFIATHVSRKLN